ncbi:winged helix-turn-helix domain-containing protein [Nocardia sp. N13]|uniref:winged helix-turn-helix domain-containing protein n=1 Tax=Nocardioides sp. N13(2025) TaxID=3453405 RepID=UPI003F7670D6
MDQLTQLQARRIALAAQGFTDRAHATPSMRTFDRTLQRTGVLQVDSVNVLQRAHYMPLYSRMGPYDVDLLRRASERRPRRVVEYWAHVQALMPVELWPLMRHRMEKYRGERGKWGFTADADLEPQVLAAVRDRGPVTARDLEEEFSTGPRTKEHWGWNWSESRKVLDYLYLVGDVAIAGRTSQFEVLYDVPERVLPATVLAAPTPTPQEAVTELVRRAARSHGVASATCLADYYRLRLQPADGRPSVKAAVDELVGSGELTPVKVQGWKRQAYLHRDARLPRRVGARTLLSPFDPVVWERARAEALFDFFYRIEIYVPAEKRLHGYYVLPFLLGDRLVARVDLKADRATGSLLVPGAFAEPHAPEETAEELALELRRLAGWLGLDEVVVGRLGDLSDGLRVALGR